VHLRFEAVDVEGTSAFVHAIDIIFIETITIHLEHHQVVFIDLVGLLCSIDVTFNGIDPFKYLFLLLSLSLFDLSEVVINHMSHLYFVKGQFLLLD